MAQPNKDKNHLEGTCVQCCWVVLLSNRFCEHRVAQAPPRRRSGSDVSRPSTPRWLAPLISAGTAAVASPESAGAAWRWASSYHRCRSGRGTPTSPAPKYALGDEESRNDNSRWKTLACEQRECGEAGSKDVQESQGGGDTMHGMIKGLYLHAGWPA